MKFRLKTDEDEFDEHVERTKMLCFAEDDFLQPAVGVFISSLSKLTI